MTARPACCVTGSSLGAAHEEQFTRIKGDERFPARAAEYCVAAAHIGSQDLGAVVFYDKPVLKLDRLLETYLSNASHGLRAFLKVGPLIRELRWSKSLGLLYSGFTDHAGRCMNAREYTRMSIRA